MPGILTLTPLSEGDAANLFTLWSDPETVRYTNWSLVGSRDEGEVRVKKLLQRYSRGSGRVGPSIVRTSTGDFAGIVGADVEEPYNGRHELWYVLRRDQWGKGIGRATVGEFLKVLAGTAGVERAVATAAIANTASWRILEGAGLKRTSVVPHGFNRNGIVCDLLRYERPIQSQSPL